MNTPNENFQEYVVVFPKTVSSSEKILLVEKDRPEWQKGRFNLVGGHVEQGEGIAEAAVREFAEETGMGILGKPEQVGTIEGTNCVVHIFQVIVGDNQKITPRPQETEKVSWKYWDEIKNDSKLIPNLKVVIPLCMAGVRGWILEDIGNEIGIGSYNMKISF